MIREQLRARRNRLGMSQAALAQKIGSTQGRIGDYETGRVGLTLDVLEKLAEVLGPFTVETSSPQYVVSILGHLTDDEQRRVMKAAKEMAIVYDAKKQRVHAADAISTNIVALGRAQAEAWRAILSACKWSDGKSIDPSLTPSQDSWFVACRATTALIVEGGHLSGVADIWDQKIKFEDEHLPPKTMRSVMLY